MGRLIELKIFEACDVECTLLNDTFRKVWGVLLSIRFYYNAFVVHHTRRQSFIEVLLFYVYYSRLCIILIGNKIQKYFFA